MLTFVAFACALVVRRAEIEATTGDVVADGPTHPTRGDPHLHNDGHMLMNKYGGLPDHADAACYGTLDVCKTIQAPSPKKCQEAGCSFAPAVEIKHSPTSPKPVTNCYCNTGCGETKFEGHDITKMYENSENYDSPMSSNYSARWSACNSYEGNGPGNTCHHALCAQCYWLDEPCGHSTQITKKDNLVFSDKYLCCRPHQCALDYEVTEHWDAQDAATGDLTGEKASRTIHGIAYAKEGEHPAAHWPPNKGCKSTDEWTTRGYKTKWPKQTTHDDGCYNYGIFSLLYGGCGIFGSR